MSDKTDSTQSNGGPAVTDTAAGAESNATEAKADGAKPADGKTDGKSPEKTGDPLAEARAEAAKNREQWVRTAADFDNFRKRSRREVEDARKSGREELLKDFLPVFDNLERALQSAQRATEVKGVVDGLVMIMKQFGDTLGRSGITKVPTKGVHFDPTMHEAIQQVESDEAPGTVVAEVQPGYLQGDRLVRAALVVVAQPRASAGKDGKDSKEASSETAGGQEAPEGAAEDGGAAAEKS